MTLFLSKLLHFFDLQHPISFVTFPVFAQLTRAFIFPTHVIIFYTLHLTHPLTQISLVCAHSCYLSYLFHALSVMPFHLSISSPLAISHQQPHHHQHFSNLTTTFALFASHPRLMGTHSNWNVVTLFTSIHHSSHIPTCGSSKYIISCLLSSTL